jgi:hypothetical protein
MRDLGVHPSHISLFLPYGTLEITKAKAIITIPEKVFSFSSFPTVVEGR